MDAQVQSNEDMPKVAGVRGWLLAYPRAIPLAIFLAIATITALSVYSIESNERAREKAQLNEYAQAIGSALERRATSFSSYLRAGAALFSSLDEVQPRVFRQFVAELRLDVEYRGNEGIGWVEVVEPGEIDRFVRNRFGATATRSAIYPAPQDPNKELAVVTYFSPETERNRNALGFDMSSDPVQASALEEASRTVRPTASGKVLLTRQGIGRASGFIMFMPVYRGLDADRKLAGYIFAPFNASAFLDSALDREDVEEMGARLYDGPISGGSLLVNRDIANGGNRSVDLPVTVADRELTLVIESEENLFLTPLSMVTLLFGIAVASLLMLLARLITQQAYDDQERLDFYEEQNSIRNSLTRELNHRVKNTLANVLSILSLTRRRADNLDDFADSLQGRIRALSATHDLLTHSDWGTISIVAVIKAELQHFRAGVEHSIDLDGPEVELAPNDALSFGLAIHELATNAAKYGSLSVAGGSVRVSWTLIEPNLAEVEWRESDGPEVQDMRSRGFGTDLIEKIVAHELRNPVKLDFQREGVRCLLRVPIRRRGDFKLRDR